MLGLNHIIANWQPVAELREFGHYLGGALALNLGYSILLRLGNFSGKRIGAWADGEQIRVIPAMAENAIFDERKFVEEITGIERTFKDILRFSNLIAILWAVIASAAILVILAVFPYCGNCVVPGGLAIWWELFLAGPTPAGVAAFLIVQWIAIRQMRGITKECDGLIKYASDEKDEKIAGMREALKRRLADARRD